MKERINFEQSEKQGSEEPSDEGSYFERSEKQGFCRRQSSYIASQSPYPVRNFINKVLIEVLEGNF
ncbi:MAG: hypothetical protein COX90_01035 [Candidatus Nealsonbacteria bacterium CG_4_10_14_0_2_um_filter_38_17]|uniref:Uncharacterized protein n=2 Tax=Candidatus Nealsoniibacteriota TaxID=1817911 RepID=A0A2M7UYT7_9BACT|nr:MAG: hypothetical protein COX36_00345 [Candidatus Nealsonbacteria bacterium CG23_combo_of_CG06-09_8_20_14_all_38_19]PIZ89143.1 MAG: hypothetical protein COX90_01035 [Candidatus Nealsonbacteria bacterium CG_4_10_14_0_2_um_filter_38_17]